MENLIKKNFMMQSDKLRNFAEKNPVQMTLREEVEEINLELQDLRNRHKKLIENFYNQNKDDSSKNHLDQQSTIDELRKKLQFA